jgi:hypothetical protein
MADWISSLKALKPLFELDAKRHGGLRIYLYSGPHHIYHRHQRSVEQATLKAFDGKESCGMYGFRYFTTSRLCHVIGFAGDRVGAKRFKETAAKAGQCIGPHTEHLVADWERHLNPNNADNVIKDWSHEENVDDWLAYQIGGNAEPTLWTRIVFAIGRQCRPGSLLRIPLCEFGRPNEFELYHLDIDPFLASVAAIDAMLEDAEDSLTATNSERRLTATTIEAFAGEVGDREALYSPPRSPQDWSKIFDMSWDALKKQFDSQQIQNKKLTTKSYRVRMDCLPAEQK